MAAASSAPLLPFSSFSFDVPTLSSQTHAKFPLFSAADQSGQLMGEKTPALQLIDKLDELWFSKNVLRWDSNGQPVHAMEDARVVSNHGTDRELVPSSPLTTCNDHEEELLRPRLAKLKPKDESIDDPGMDDKGERGDSDGEVARHWDTELKMEESDDHPNVMHQEDQKLPIQAWENEDELLTSKKVNLKIREEEERDIYRMERHKAVTLGKPPLQTINSGRQLLTDIRAGIPLSRRRRRVRRKRIKTQTDLEYDEVKGFKDLGFNFREDELTPSIVSLVPGLKPLNKKCTESTDMQSETSPIQRLYPPEDWWLRKRKTEPRRIPDLHGEGIDMKEQLKFWAHIVASNVRQEC